MAKVNSIEKIEKKEAQRRHLRSKYVEIRRHINEGRNDQMAEPEKFMAIVIEVENLHQHVKKPREQVADGKALLDLSSTLVDSAKSHTTGDITPSDFVSSLYRHFGVQNRSLLSGNGANLLHWKDIGVDVAHIFKNGRGCFTMTGPMNIQSKQRKSAVRRRKRAWLGGTVRPEKVYLVGVQTDTEKSIHIMFEILKQKYPVKLEHLILNRHSFSQTVENLFALSFLVKDGHLAVYVDQNGSHFISPKNPPASKLVMSGEVENTQFIFRLDFSDWKQMVGLVSEGEELMPHRKFFDNSIFQVEPVPESNTTPIDVLWRNCNDILEGEIMAKDTSEHGHVPTATLKCKKKLLFL